MENSNALNNKHYSKDLLASFDFIFSSNIFVFFAYTVLSKIASTSYWFDYTISKILFLNWIFTTLWFFITYFDNNDDEKKQKRIDQVFFITKIALFALINIAGIRFGLLDPIGWFDGLLTLLFLFFANYSFYNIIMM
jgi:hypothetical protein